MFLLILHHTLMTRGIVDLVHMNSSTSSLSYSTLSPLIIFLMCHCLLLNYFLFAKDFTLSEELEDFGFSVALY